MPQCGLTDTGGPCSNAPLWSCLIQGDLVIMHCVESVLCGQRAISHCTAHN